MSCKDDCEPCCTLSIEGAEQDRFTSLLRAAGNPIRFEILKYLVTHSGCITGNIVDHLPIAQSTVSQHLRVLRDAGWIDGMTEGPATCYCLSKENIEWFKKVVARIF